eukprot:1176438-Prorocentrum_minimum.AAC.3
MEFPEDRESGRTVCKVGGTGFISLHRLPAIVPLRNPRAGVVWSSEDAHGPQHRLQTTNQVVQYVKGVYRIRLIAPVTNDSDVQESQQLGSVCRKRAPVPGT